MTTAAFLPLMPLMPLAILAVGILTVLMLGAFVSSRYGILVGLVAILAAAAWTLSVSPATAPATAPLAGFVFSPFARFFAVLFCATGAFTLLMAHGYNRRHGIGGEEFPATVLAATFGMVVLGGAENLVHFFLGLEGLTFAFYILIAADRTRPASSEAGIKFLLQGATSAASIAFGIALLYAAVGSLDIAPAMRAVAEGSGQLPIAWAGWGFLLMGLAFKVSLVPAHLWTPDVYQGAPAPVVAFLSTGSKAAGFAALLLLLTALGPGHVALRLPLWGLSLLSMVLGNLAALRQKNLPRMLAYSSIAQMGYAALALLTGTREGFAAVAFFMAVYAAMNLAAFGAIASVQDDGHTAEVEEFRGLGYRRPLQGAVLALALVALAGIPPTAGFMGKFVVFAAALAAGEVALAVIGIITAIVSVYYYLRVVVVLYTQPAAGEGLAPCTTTAEITVLIATSAAILFIGIYPAPLMDAVDIIFP